MACNAPLISHMSGPLGIWERYLHYISLSPSSISFMWFSLNTPSTVTSAVLYENTLATSSVISSKKTYKSMKKQKWNDERSENLLASRQDLHYIINFLAWPQFETECFSVHWLAVLIFDDWNELHKYTHQVCLKYSSILCSSNAEVNY